MLPDVITCWRTNIYRIYLFTQTKYEMTEVLRLLLISQDSLDFFPLAINSWIFCQFDIHSLINIAGRRIEFLSSLGCFKDIFFRPALTFIIYYLYILGRESEPVFCLSLIMSHILLFLGVFEKIHVISVDIYCALLDFLVGFDFSLIKWNKKPFKPLEEESVFKSSTSFNCLVEINIINLILSCFSCIQSNNRSISEMRLLLMTIWL